MMEGYILLSDGTRLDGELRGAQDTALGWLVANTAVVGFQEMATDPCYFNRILAFTYPEVGNVGVNAAFSESGRVQAAGLVVKVLSAYRSHYLSEEDFESMLSRDGVPCVTGVDTRWLAVHLREKGETAAAVAPAEADADQLLETLRGLEPRFRPTAAPSLSEKGSGPTVAVLNLGLRRSELRQLAACCRPVVLPHDADAEAVMGCRPAGLYVSDGPSGALPPAHAVNTIKALLGHLPILASGLGHVALGLALGCSSIRLKRGHHGASYPVRNVRDSRLQITQQRHTVVLDRGSVEGQVPASLLWENINDSTVEGICSEDGSAVGLQFVLAAPGPGVVNPHIKDFVGRLGSK